MLEHEKQIHEYEKTLEQIRQQNQANRIWSNDEMRAMEKKLEELKNKVYSELSAWERIAICRHPDRPRSVDYIKALCDEFVEIFGDRLFRDDHSIIAGFGKIGEQKIVVIAQEKGCDTESRLLRNFGMTYPEGYRKALRAMQLAEKFHLPVLCLIDTPGAYPGLDAEERGQGWAIATNLMKMARLRTPIVSVVIGEGNSGGALGIGVADVIAMLQHSYYSVISPEGCASILWKESDKKETAAESLKLHPEDLLELGIIDKIIDEPLGGAHHDKKAVFESVKAYILEQIEELSFLTEEALIEKRYQKYRCMGRFEDPAALLP